ncbi:hypothetical protein C8R47DRAFT_971591, partial [Mycena vitilis]
MLSLKAELEDADVQDRGTDRPTGVSRYYLTPKLFKRVDRVVGELQYFLQRAAAMVAGRTRFFRIDPEDAIVPIFRGCNNLSQIIAAWGIIRKRLELGQRFFQKYVKEFQTPEANIEYSPASTSVELTDDLK